MSVMVGLTQNQIQELYKFTRIHFVEHYDLQTELVDHLANGIEEQWKRHPKLSFNEACCLEFKKFGVAGFQDVIDKKGQAIRKKYRHILWGFYKEFFRWPKIGLIFGLVLFITTLLLFIPLVFRYNAVIAIFFLIVLTVFYSAFKSRRDNELEAKKYGKKWMLKDVIYSYGNLIHMINLLPLTLNMGYIRDRVPMDNFWVLMAFAIGIVLTLILSYVTIFVIPSKADELLGKTYPEYKLL
ncbi:hypothetical protein [Zobellia sp. OII3]|uniref:hypothetical protein n=1 Tax=Zobellia sp. OII3 TaxID=2034520 RepID=UPI000F5087DF|nr:hypothetical protein [Zobellia sp. OII3]